MIKTAGSKQPNIEDIKRSFADAGIVYDNDADYEEALRNLVGFFDVLIQMDLQQKAAKRQSENPPPTT